MKIIHLKQILWMLSLGCLAGCGNQAFDCPYREGLRCVRLSEVDRRIDNCSLASETKSAMSKTQADLSEFASLQRGSEEVLSLWVAPYQSKEGLVHEQQWIHFVAAKATGSGIQDFDDD